jgi:hypothetical protein
VASDLGDPSAQRSQRLRCARALGPGLPAPQAAGDAPAFDGHRLDRVAAVLAAPTARRPFPSVHGGPIFGRTSFPTLDAAGGDSIPRTTHLRGRPTRWVGPAGKEAFFAAALSGTHGGRTRKRSIAEVPSLMGKNPRLSRPNMRRCPPHTPLTVDHAPGGGCVVECLGCGKRGPERATSEAARAAFFEALAAE